MLAAEHVRAAFHGQLNFVCNRRGKLLLSAWLNLTTADCMCELDVVRDSQHCHIHHHNPGPAHATSPSGSSVVTNCSCNAGYQPSGQNCTACVPGKYKPTLGNVACSSCPQASLCAGGTALPQPAPAGLLCPAAAASAADCKQCDAGSYCPSGLRLCVLRFIPFCRCDAPIPVSSRRVFYRRCHQRKLHRPLRSGLLLSCELQQSDRAALPCGTRGRSFAS